MDAVDHNVGRVLEEKIAYCRQKLALVERLGPHDSDSVLVLQTKLLMYKLMLQMEEALREMVI